MDQGAALGRVCVEYTEILILQNEKFCWVSPAHLVHAPFLLTLVNVPRGEESPQPENTNRLPSPHTSPNTTHGIRLPSEPFPGRELLPADEPPHGEPLNKLSLGRGVLLVINLFFGS